LKTFFTKIISCFLIVVLALLSMYALSQKDQSQEVPTLFQRHYDELYPYYVEVCALSQIQKLDAPKGGSAGHAVMYLKGVRKKDGPYPMIELCPEGGCDLSSADSGVGVSVNKIFKNVNWVAVPKKSFFLNANLDENEPLTEERFQAAIQHAVQQDLFEGIEIHGQFLKNKPHDVSLEEFIASESIGTDYAINFGRTIFCQKLPVTPAVLDKVIQYLNSLNEEYYSGKADYNWSGYYDNCAHMVHNALAAMGIWKPKKVHTVKLRQLLNLAVPANIFADFALLTDKYPLEDMSKIYREKNMRKDLMEEGWLPARHGALPEIRGPHHLNDMFVIQLKIFILQMPLLRPKSNAVRNLVHSEKNSNVKSNLIFYKKRYENILKEREGRRMRGLPEEFVEKYYDYIETQLKDVEDKLNLLRERKEIQE